MNKEKNTYAIKVTFLYILFAGVWISFSDRLLQAVASDLEQLTRLQTIKGWLFVVFTGCMFYASLYYGFRSRRRTEQRLRETNEKLSALIQASPLAIMTLDAEARVLSWNVAAETMFGWQEREVLGCLNPLVPEDKWLECRRLHKQALAGKPVYNADVTRKKKDGTLVDVSMSASVIRNAAGETNGVIVVLADITEQKRKEEQLRFLSLHDALTGIYNRAYFEQEMLRAEAGRLPAAGIIVCDVDGLKLYNDSLGHTTGDALIQAAARVISSCFRESDVVARIGGDEFAVLLPDSDASIVESACDRIREAIMAYNEQQRDLYLSVSIGYAVSTGPLRMWELFKEADDNMYREKLRRAGLVRNTTIQTLMRTLSARDIITEGQPERMEEMDLVRLADWIRKHHK